jgi:hypothetical protein
MLLGRATAEPSPAAEFFNGQLHPAAEHYGRLDAILHDRGIVFSAEHCS